MAMYSIYPNYESQQFDSLRTVVNPEEAETGVHSDIHFKAFVLEHIDSAVIEVSNALVLKESATRPVQAELETEIQPIVVGSPNTVEFSSMILSRLKYLGFAPDVCHRLIQNKYDILHNLVFREPDLGKKEVLRGFGKAYPTYLIDVQVEIPRGEESLNISGIAMTKNQGQGAFYIVERNYFLVPDHRWGKRLKSTNSAEPSKEVLDRINETRKRWRPTGGGTRSTSGGYGISEG